MKISTPQKKNYRLNELKLETLKSGDKGIQLHFKDDETHLMYAELFILFNDDYYSVKGNSIFSHIADFIIMFDDVELDEYGANDFLIKFQKRLKAKVRYEQEGVKEEAPETVKDETPVQVVVEPKKEEPRVMQVKIERPQAVGLEGQLQDMVFKVLESDYTSQTIQNKMIQLGIEPNRVEITVKREGAEPKKVGDQHKDFTKILKTIEARVNIALVGAAGSGKTTTVKNVAEALDLPFFSKSVSAQTGTHEFFGYEDANGNYVRTLFREAYENGGVFLLDEFDAGNPNVLASMNQATANDECAFADKMVKKHENFIVVMAGNTFGHGATSEYVGRNKIDAATLDRFAFINFDYDEELEYKLATNKQWCKKVQKLRKVAAEKRIKTIISPRATFEGSKLLNVGLSEDDVMQMLIYKGLTEDEVRLLKK